ncbi:MAG: hypothetical protein ACHQK8_09335, partial [Bacteroidia bacterium]
MLRKCQYIISIFLVAISFAATAQQLIINQSFEDLKGDTFGSHTSCYFFTYIADFNNLNSNTHIKAFILGNVNNDKNGFPVHDSIGSNGLSN